MSLRRNWEQRLRDCELRFDQPMQHAVQARGHELAKLGQVPSSSGALRRIREVAVGLPRSTPLMTNMEELAAVARRCEARRRAPELGLRRADGRHWKRPAGRSRQASLPWNRSLRHVPAAVEQAGRRA